jgi:NDP-sugar pyrophosphorylase family protein
MLEFHYDHDAMATMAVRDYTYQIPFGVLTIEGERIVSIEEKPAHTEFVNAGIYVLSPESMEYVRSDEYLDMPTLFQKLIENGKPTSAFAIREYWLDIGRHDEFEKAQEEWQKK